MAKKTSSGNRPGSPVARGITVHVGQKEIDEAVRKHSGHCMIEESIKKKFPYFKHISVDLQTIRYTDRKTGLRIARLTPLLPQRILVGWDQGLKPKPFSFSLKGRAQITTAQLNKKFPRPARAGKKSPLARSPRKKVLVSRHPTSAPDIIGGRMPPGVPQGQRREFGIRKFVGPELRNLFEEST